MKGGQNGARNYPAHADGPENRGRKMKRWLQYWRWKIAAEYYIASLKFNLAMGEIKNMLKRADIWDFLMLICLLLIYKLLVKL